MELDKLDVGILRLLLQAADLSHREVARRVGASPTTVGERLKSMKRAGLVEGATLRLGPDALPGHARLVRGRVPPEGKKRVCAEVQEVPGVTEAGVGRDGTFVAFVVVRDLQAEERVLEALSGLGVEDLSAASIDRAVGPPLAHLFEDAVAVVEVCVVCATETTEPVVEVVDGRRVVFCCPSCRSIYLERYKDLSRKAKQ